MKTRKRAKRQNLKPLGVLAMVAGFYALLIWLLRKKEE